MSPKMRISRVKLWQSLAKLSNFPSPDVWWGWGWQPRQLIHRFSRTARSGFVSDCRERLGQQWLDKWRRTSQF